MTTKIDQVAFEDAQECGLGWCNVCKAFTREGCEPDAEGEGYDCPECESSTVVGAELALIMNLIAFDECDG